MKVNFLHKFNAEKTLSQRNKVSLKERSTVYVLKFIPAMNCVVYQVDGYIISGADRDKCDKLVFAETNSGEQISIFVELKGSDVTHAIKQLDATLMHPLFANNRTKWMKARVVANKIPANSGKSVVERAKVDFRKKYNCELICLKSEQPDLIKQDKLK